MAEAPAEASPTTDATHPPQSLRIVLCTDHPAVAGAMQQVVPALGHTLVALVTSSKRRASSLNVVAAMAPNVDILITNSARRVSRWLANLDFDVLLSVSFPLRLRAETLALPRYGAVNMHPSLLPAYRGTMTGNWHLLHGEERIGITMHRMTEQFDDGPILAQTSIPIGPDDDVNTVMMQLFSNGPQIMVEGFTRLLAGDPGTPQDESQASYFGVIDPALRSIDWSLPARTLHNRVRAFSGDVAELGVLAHLDGQPVCITRTRVHSDEGADQPAGTRVHDDAGALLVQCGSGVLELVESSPANA